MITSSYSVPPSSWKGRSWMTGANNPGKFANIKPEWSNKIRLEAGVWNVKMILQIHQSLEKRVEIVVFRLLMVSANATQTALQNIFWKADIDVLPFKLKFLKVKATALTFHSVRLRRLRHIIHVVNKDCNLWHLNCPLCEDRHGWCSGFLWPKNNINKMWHVQNYHFYNVGTFNTLTYRLWRYHCPQYTAVLSDV